MQHKETVPVCRITLLLLNYYGLERGGFKLTSHDTEAIEAVSRGPPQKISRKYGNYRIPLKAIR